MSEVGRTGGQPLHNAYSVTCDSDRHDHTTNNYGAGAGDKDVMFLWCIISFIEENVFHLYPIYLVYYYTLQEQWCSCAGGQPCVEHHTYMHLGEAD